MLFFFMPPLFLESPKKLKYFLAKIIEIVTIKIGETEQKLKKKKTTYGTPAAQGLSAKSNLNIASLRLCITQMSNVVT